MRKPLSPPLSTCRTLSEQAYQSPISCYNPRVANTNFAFPLTVRLYDVDVREEVSCATLFRYFEETAIRGSAHFGFTLGWYQKHQQFWVIRTMRMERVCAPHYLDELEIRTWVSSMARVRSDRNYEVRHAGGGRILARGIANWVYVDASQMTPTRIHPEITAMFEPRDPPVLPPLNKLTLAPPQVTAPEHVSARRAQFYEADSARHTNNAVYVDWVEEVIRNAVRGMGYPLASDPSAPFLWFYRHALEYARPALPGDSLELRARLSRRGQSVGEWQVEILRTHSREILLRAQSTTIWVDAGNRPVSWRKLTQEH